MVVVAVIGPALVVCLVGARIWSGLIRAVLLGQVSGSLWGLFAVLTKGVVDRARRRGITLRYAPQTLQGC